ncbi:MAG: class II aldolase/adducin family protein [Kiritimatiellales bacterium]|nr:class II aldolase/adducin family protein [Kiritimatiellales bacterium]
MPVNEQQLREDMCEIARMMAAKGFICGPAGNISARLGDDRYLLTPTMFFKQKLKPEQLIIINGQGEKVGPETDATREMKPTSEVPMHLGIYKTRPDIGGVVHAHPVNCVALTAAGKPFRPQVLTEGMLFLGAIGVAEYATPTTQELGDRVAETVVDHDCVVLPYHGVIVGGSDMWDALAKLEVLDQVAEICGKVNAMGGEVPLDRKHVAGMLELRKKYGMNRDSDCDLLE